MTSWTGAYVDKIAVGCLRWSSKLRRLEPARTYSYDRSFGEVGALNYLGQIKRNQAVLCPGEKVGKAIRGKYGSYVDSLQFVCDDSSK